MEENEGQRQETQHLPEGAGDEWGQRDGEALKGRNKLPLSFKRLLRGCGMGKKGSNHRDMQQQKDGVLRILQLEKALPDRASRAEELPANEPSEHEKVKGVETTDETERHLCVRLPFSDRQVPIYRPKPLTLSEAVVLSGPKASSFLLSLVQSTFTCCVANLAVSVSKERQVANAYIRAQLLQELAFRIQLATGQPNEPHVAKPNCPSNPCNFPVPSGKADGALRANPLRPQADRDAGSEPMKDLSRSPEVTWLLNHYSKLLVAEKMNPCNQRGGITGKDTGSTSHTDDLWEENTSFPMMLLTSPLFSCLQLSPWYLWQPGNHPKPRPQRSFRLSVELLHVSLAECYLFREEDRLAQKLLGTFEAYAYLARYANGEQLTAKLRRFFELSMEMRCNFGLAQQLQPLLHMAQAVVTVFIGDKHTELQRDLLQQELQQFPHLQLHVQQFIAWLLKLRTEHPTVRPRFPHNS